MQITQSFAFNLFFTTVSMLSCASVRNPGMLNTSFIVCAINRCYKKWSQWTQCQCPKNASVTPLIKYILLEYLLVCRQEILGQYKLRENIQKPFWVSVLVTSIFLVKSRVTFFFDIHVWSYFATQNCRNFPLHESPGNVGPNQGAFLATGTVHLWSSALHFDAIPGARETELVLTYWWTLYKVRVLETLVAKCAF